MVKGGNSGSCLMYLHHYF